MTYNGRQDITGEIEIKCTILGVTQNGRLDITGEMKIEGKILHVTEWKARHYRCKGNRRQNSRCDKEWKAKRHR